MNSIFQRLISYSPRDGRTPYEDYVTELMCGVVEATPGLKVEFIKYILSRLGVDETNRPKSIDGWHIKTQYRIDSGRRPDVAILDANGNMMLLIEHKIDSGPGLDQLMDYATYLKGKASIGLVLLTQFNDLDEKGKDEIRKKPPKFRTVWWSELSDFFLTRVVRKDDWLLVEFNQFLKEERMALPDKFDTDDISAMRKFPDVIAVMDKILNGVNNEFSGLVHRVIGGASRSTQLQRWGRYVEYGSLRDGDDTMNAFVGFLFDQRHIGIITGKDVPEGGLAPMAFVSVETNPKGDDSERSVGTLHNFSQAIEHRDTWRFINTTNPYYWTRIAAFIDIGELIETSSAEKPNHVEILTEWFKERIGELCELKSFLPDAK